ncbi:MAG TPA: PadR family transcriptional regulator [Terriglobales bacterium]|nr:PadR family transcriptional regulator [Terriglobales bacterium]
MPPPLLPGTLDLMILETLRRGPLHGYGIARLIRQRSDEVLKIEEGSLYPALQRLLLEGWVTAQWRQSETKRRARFYSLTAAGRKQLGLEISSFEKMVAAIRGVLGKAVNSEL